MVRRIAMIDDSQLELKWLTRELAGRGYEVLGCDQSLGVQAFVARHQPDVILMDVNMPALSGDVLCKMLRENPRTRNVPVLLYSSLPVQELDRLSRECGAHGYILKNHDVEALTRRLDRMLSGR